MRGLGGKVLTSDVASANDAGTSNSPAFRRVLVAIRDGSEIEPALELVRRTGASEARILHLSLRESISGRRYAIEADSAADAIVEAAVLEFRVAGITATGQVRHALIDRAAQAITTDATEWAADLIVLGVPRRGRLAGRLFGSVALRVQQLAPCPVLVASAPGKDHPHRAEQHVTSVTGANGRTRSDHLSAAPLR